jgi:8-oxo-dGTP diphosphatase
MKQNDSKYLNPALTVDLVLLTIEDDELKVLLIKRANEPFKGKRALPGGFLLKGETTRDAALRILKEKAGISNVYAEQLYTFDALDRDPRGSVFSVTYFALAPRTDIRFAESDKSQNPEFVTADKFPSLAFDHKTIVDYSIKRLRAKLEYTNAAYSLLPRNFTLSQLQRTYEIILGKSFDKRNFQKKILQLDLISQTKKILTGGRQRPAKLYEFRLRKPTELRKFI